MKHYSVRKSKSSAGKYKVVLAGGFFGYEDTDLPLFDNLETAMSYAERLQKLKGSR